MSNVNGRGVYAGLSLYSQRIVSDLALNFGITRNKTEDFSPHLSTDHPHAWALFAGMMAGDGHVRKDNSSGYPTVHFITKSANGAAWVKQLWESLVIGEINIYKTSKHYFNLELQGNRALIVIAKMALYDFGYGRKAQIINELLIAAEKQGITQ